MTKWLPGALVFSCPSAGLTINFVTAGSEYKSRLTLVDDYFALTFVCENIAASNDVGIRIIIPFGGENKTRISYRQVCSETILAVVNGCNGKIIAFISANIGIDDGKASAALRAFVLTGEAA